MAAIRYRLRVDVRRGWRACLGLAIVTGLVGGAVLALAAGARRTDSAYDRFLDAQRAYDVMASVSSPGFLGPTDGAVDPGAIARLPGVAQVASAGSFFIINYGAGVGVLVPPDERIGTAINRFKLLEGRRPDPRDPTEAVVSFTFADQYDVHVGDRITVLHPDVLGDPPPDTDPELVTALLAAREHVLRVLPDNTLTVVGIEASPGEFPPQIEGTGRYLIHASPALYPIKDDLAFFSEGGDQTLVRLAPGTDLERFLQRLDHLGVDGVVVQRDLAVGVNRSVHTQAVALRLLALLSALAGALVVGQLLARFMYLGQGDARVLGALGMRRRDRFALGIGRGMLVGGLAALVAVLVAVLASPFFPTGLARTAEPSPGPRLDAEVLLVGAVAVALVVVLLSAWPAWRAARTSIDTARAMPATPALRRLDRAPPPVAAGIRMALEPGHDRSAIAVRSSLAAVTLGIATLVAAITFGAGLTHLLDTPALYGQSWDAALTTYDELVPTRAPAVLAADRRVEGVAVGKLRAPFELDARRVDGMAIDTVDGRLAPTLLEGRRPRGPGEIALGTRTLRALGKGVGDVVHARPFTSERKAMRMRIVGRAVFPLFGEVGRLGDGAFVTTAGWARVQGDTLDPAEEGVLVRLRAGASLDGVVHDLVHALGDPAFGVAVISQGKPTDIVNFGRVESTPYLLGGVLVAVSTATLAYLLNGAVRGRRRDLAVFKTLGFVRGQVRSTVAVQATTTIVVALALGVPLGIIVGRWVWTRFADDLGIVAVPVVPVVPVVLTVVLALVVANLIAAAPAAIAARTRPASVLRTE
ncbi:MAG TPA: FtsX-like permease family protein [Acidimicrobiia bacterium]